MNSSTSLTLLMEWASVFFLISFIAMPPQTQTMVSMDSISDKKPRIPISTMAQKDTTGTLVAQFFHIHPHP